MKRGTESRVFLGKDTSIDEFTGINVLSTVLLGKKEGGFKDHDGLFIASNVTLGKGIARVITVVVYGTSPLSLPNAIEASIPSLKAFGGTEQRNLPDGYTQLEYIETTGTQYISLNLNNTTRFVVTAQNSALTTSNQVLLVGDTTANAGTWIGCINNGKWGAGVQEGTYASIDSTTKVTIDVTFQGTGGLNATINNETIERTGTTANIAFCLFATSNLAYGFKGKIFSLEAYQNGTLVRNMFPCKNSSDVIGMYDTVNDVFYTNAGTGTFTAGGEAVPTPDAPMDIISNNGVLKVSPNLFDKNASYALFNGYVNNASVGQNTVLVAYAGGDKTIIIKVAPNTTYTVTRATNLGSVYDRIRCAAFTTLPSGGSTGVILYNLSSNAQQANATFTTLSDTQYVAINVRNSSAVGDDWTQFVDAFQLEKGSPATPYMPYGQIYTDGTVETINVHTKNLFDPNALPTFTGDLAYIVGGQPEPISDGFKVTLKTATSSTYNYYLYLPIEDGYVYSCEAPAVGGFGTLNNNWAFIYSARGNGGLPAGTVIEFHKVQLEAGSTATTYAPYYDGGTATAEMLLKVGTYQDVQSIIDGAVARNVGVLVLDGTEEIWGTQSQTPDNITILTNCYTVAIPLGDAPIDKRRVYCTHLISSDTLPAADARQGYALLGNGGSGTPAPLTNKYAVGLGLTTRFPTIAGLKQYLAAQYAAGTPVIVIYPLATATTESVTGQPMETTQGDNIAEITQASMDGLTLEVTYLAGATVTIQEVENAQLSDDVDVTIH